MRTVPCPQRHHSCSSAQQQICGGKAGRRRAGEVICYLMIKCIKNYFQARWFSPYALAQLTRGLFQFDHLWMRLHTDKLDKAMSEPGRLNSDHRKRMWKATGETLGEFTCKSVLFCENFFFIDWRMPEVESRWNPITQGTCPVVAIWCVRAKRSPF